MKDSSVLAIVGPTGSGKTEVSLELGKLLAVEIVSADSMQFYIDMNVGTAKLPIEKRTNPVHHMIDICFPDVNYSAYLFQKSARKCVEGINRRNHIPLITGGSTLYVAGLLYDINFPPGGIDSELRRELEEKASSDPDSLWQEMRTIDPEGYQLIKERNIRRAVRALEVFHLTGIKYSELNNSWKNRKLYYKASIYCITQNRQELYQRIEKRVDLMIEQGLVEETKRLLSEYKLGTTARQALGYKEIIAYLDGEIALDEAIKVIKKRTKNYAKRQMTWFKNDPQTKVIDVTDMDKKEIATLIFEEYKQDVTSYC